MNTAVYGFDNLEPALEELARKGLLTVKARFTHTGGNDRICSNDLLFDKLPHEPYDYDMPLGMFEEFQKQHLTQVMANIGRIDSYTGKQTGYASGIYTFRNITCFLYDLLLKNDIQLCLFSSLPHEVVDTILFSLAKTLGIQSRICMDGFYNEKKFHCITDPCNYGLYKNRKKVSEPNLALCKYIVDSKHNIKDNAWAKTNVSLLQTRLSMVMASAETRPLNILLEEEFLLERAGIIPQNPDQIDNYVYFPLHFQPELATIGASHPLTDDQALCLEYLAQKLPENTAILVKEQPSQFFYYRDSLFFNRLRAIPQLRFVSAASDSHSLIQGARCVATVTGSAGWEALMFGKPVIYFGRPNYRQMPGAFAFTEDLDVRAVFAYQGSREKLEQAQCELLSTMYDGVINIDAYADFGYQEPDRDENIKICTQSLQSIVQDIPLDSPNYIDQLREKMDGLRKKSYRHTAALPQGLSSFGEKKTRKKIYPAHVLKILKLLKKVEGRSSAFRLQMLNKYFSITKRS